MSNASGYGRCWFGDCRETLPAIAAEGLRARCCVTSPPYFGLRDYGTGVWTGGDLGCAHQVGEIRTGLGMRELSADYRGGGAKVSERKPLMARAVCPHCGAVREDRQIGLEGTVDEYVRALVEVFGLVRDVLAEDGTLWLNLGDSYAGTGGAEQGAGGAMAGRAVVDCRRAPGTYGLPPKNLLGVPWRVALALQADGWYLRQDIIWHKPNPMPESVRDRCTKAHEYLFLLSKSERYYFDAAAIRERDAGADHARNLTPPVVRAPGLLAPHTGLRKSEGRAGEGRNRRSVWTVATRPYSGAHFAVFPPALVRPCILAGSAAGDTVLDPFLGSGTTGQVAQELGRRWVGCELNGDYASLQAERTAQGGLALC